MKTTLLLEYMNRYDLISSLWEAKERYNIVPDRVILAREGRHA